MRHIQSFTNDAAIQEAIDNKTLGKPYVALNNQTGTIDWDSKTPTEPKDMYLTIEALSGGTFNIKRANIGYSVNGGNWETTTGETALALNQGDAVRFKGAAGGNSLFSGNTLAFNAYGNIESLEYGDNFVGQTSVSAVSAFTLCFGDCTGLANASNLVLPATTLTNRCYKEMFSRCTSLTAAPALPATTLADSCYNNMFYGCTSLTSVPALPAITLADFCYNNMFHNCTALETPPELPATSLARSCYQLMFQSCTSLTAAPELPATTLTDYCYSGMFNGCTSLTTAPELPATTLVNTCYYQMFRGCTSLNYIKCLATDISATNCTSNWVDGVAATGTFEKDPSMTGWTTGVNGIPSDWTVVDATEE